MSEEVTATDEATAAPAGRPARARLAKVKQQSAKIRFSVTTFGENAIALPDIETRLKGVTLDKKRVTAGKARIVPDDLYVLARSYRNTMYKVFNTGVIFIGEGRRIVPLGLESREWHEKEAKAEEEAKAIADKFCTQENLDRIHRFNREYWTDIVRVPIEGCDNLRALINQSLEARAALDALTDASSDEERDQLRTLVESTKLALEAATNADATEREYQRVVGWAIPESVEAMRGRFRVRVYYDDMEHAGNVLDVYDFAARFVEAGIQARIEEADEIAEIIANELGAKVVDVMSSVKDQVYNGKTIRPTTFNAIYDELDKLRYAGKALHPEIVSMIPRIERRVRAGVDEANRQVAEGVTFTNAIRKEADSIMAALDEFGSVLKARVNSAQTREHYGRSLRPITTEIRRVPTAKPAAG